MPWTQSVAEVMNVLVNAKLLTDKEYIDVRSLLSKTHVLMATDEFIKRQQEGAEVTKAFHAASDSAQVKDGDWESKLAAKVQVKTSGFIFGKASLKELEGVKTELVLCVRRALELSTQDFCVYDGLRTVKEQEQHVKNGTSKTMQSMHLKGLAVDLVPWINGGPKWDWDGCYKIAWAMDQAATEQGVANKIRWGGAWDRRLSDYGNDAQAYVNEVRDYTQRHEGKDFIDGPHFEWVD